MKPEPKASRKGQINTDSHRLIRIIDVNFNRAREATRVIEDYTRFVLDNESLSASLRNIRHSLTEIIKRLEAGNQNLLIRARNVEDDIGKENISKSSSTHEIIIANFKRLQESLRSLAEYLKPLSQSCHEDIHPPKAGKKSRSSLCLSAFVAKRSKMVSEIEKLRFIAYDLEQQVSIHLFPKKAFNDVRLYILVSSDVIHQPVIEITKQVIRGGADAIQLREKAMPDKVLLDMALQIRKLTLQYKVLFIMNDRVDIAVLSNADGVHLGKDDISIKQARKILGQDKIIGATSHNIEEALKAQKDGADYISVGPMFSSPTKPHLKPEGLTYLKDISRKIKIPYVAIGGITNSNLPALIKQHNKSFKYPIKIAISSGILGTANPVKTARHIKTILCE